MKKKILVTMCIGMMAITAMTGCSNAAATTVETVETAETDAETEPTTESEAAEPTEAEEPTEAVKSTETEEAAETETVEPEATTETKEETEAETYSYTDMESTEMYAKSSVNVRSLPSTDGERLGGLGTNEAVTVTGICNETSWYRIDYNGSVGYVSNSYLVSEKVEVQTAQNNTTAAGSETAQSGTVETGNEAAQQAGANTEATTQVTDNGSDSSFKMTAAKRIELQTYMWDHTEAELQAYATEDEWNFLVNHGLVHCTDSEVDFQEYTDAILADAGVETTVTATAQPDLLTLVNEDRANNGAEALVWDADLEATALERAVELASDFSHNGKRNCNGENAAMGQTSVETVNSDWIASSDHHFIRTSTSYTRYAAARYGNYWVELFDY